MECVLRKLNEKKVKSKEEAYYTQNIEDLRKYNSTGKALIVAEDESDDGEVEVWSTDSEDEQVRKTTHVECFVVIKEKVNKEVDVIGIAKGGTCLMVGSVSSESHGYFTDEGAKSDACFSAKNVREHIKRVRR